MERERASPRLEQWAWRAEPRVRSVGRDLKLDIAQEHGAMAANTAAYDLVVTL
jgi:hypothetical protein